MEKGDRVKIYEDPFSQDVLEGEATLIKHEWSDTEGGEQWRLRFDGDCESIVSRYIYPKNKVQARVSR